MNKKELIEMRDKMVNYYTKIVQSGRKLTVYYCHNCKEMRLEECPTKDLVSSKGYWDSMKACYFCGGVNFVLTYPSGRTISHKVPFTKDKKKGMFEYNPKKKI